MMAGTREFRMGEAALRSLAEFTTRVNAETLPPEVMEKAMACLTIVSWGSREKRRPGAP